MRRVSVLFQLTLNEAILASVFSSRGHGRQDLHWEKHCWQGQVVQCKSRFWIHQQVNMSSVRLNCICENLLIDDWKCHQGMTMAKMSTLTIRPLSTRIPTIEWEVWRTVNSFSSISYLVAKEPRPPTSQASMAFLFKAQSTHVQKQERLKMEKRLIALWTRPTTVPVHPDRPGKPTLQAQTRDHRQALTHTTTVTWWRHHIVVHEHPGQICLLSRPTPWSTSPSTDAVFRQLTTATHDHRMLRRVMGRIQATTLTTSHQVSKLLHFFPHYSMLFANCWIPENRRR